jgi:predicted nucleotidyltransferase
MIEEKSINELAEKIAREFHPDKIILFGSYAYGNPSPDSDVDLLVIMPFEGKGPYKAAEIRLRVRPKFPVDFLLRTPEKLKERLAMGDFFMREIMDKGKVLYEAGHGRMGRQSRR